MLDMAAAVPMGWMHRSIGLAGCGENTGDGEEREYVKYPLPLKIPQKHLFSAYVFRFAGPPASL